MSAVSACRMCLAVDARMYTIANTPLQDVYERITNIPLLSYDGNPKACYICFHLLKKTRALIEKWMRAHYLLRRIHNCGLTVTQESISMVDTVSLRPNLGVCATECMVVTPEETDAGTHYEIKIDMESKVAVPGDVETSTKGIQTCGAGVDSKANLKNLLNHKNEKIVSAAEEVKVEYKSRSERVSKRINQDQISNPRNIRKKYSVDTLKPLSQLLKSAEEEVELQTKLLEASVDEDKSKTFLVESLAGETGLIVTCSKTEGCDTKIDEWSVPIKVKPLDEAPDENKEVKPIANEIEPILVKSKVEFEKSEQFTDEVDPIEIEIDKTEQFTDEIRPIEAEIHKTEIFTGEVDPIEIEIDKSEQFTGEVDPIEVEIDNIDKVDKIEVEIEKSDEVDKIEMEIEKSDKVELTVEEKEKPLTSSFKKLTTNQNIICDKCGLNFKTTDILAVHMKIHHLKAKVEDDDDNIPENITLGRKTRAKVPAMELKCEQCEKVFKYPRTLIKHYKKHNVKNNRFPCYRCDQTFKNDLELSQHITTHVKDKRFKCTFCEKSFFMKGHLTEHIQTHTGAKPYVCKLCGQSFTHKSSFNRHSLTHTGTKPHICKICGKAWTQKCNLTKHLKTHENKHCFKCGQCSGIFQIESEFKYHILNTHSEK